jgi:general secretion pathway protein J
MTSGSPAYTPRLNRQRRQDRGFTLLEALVALLVLSLIMTAAFGALRIGGRSWEAGLAYTNETEELRSITGFLRRQFGQLLTTTWQDDAEKRIAFEGENDRVRFIAPAPQQLDAAGLLMFTLSAEYDDLDRRLILSHAPLDPGAEGFDASPEAERLVLMEDLEKVSFSYYGRKQTTDSPGWHARWEVDAEVFPEMIRIRIDANEDKRPWPELLLAIRGGGTP